VPAKAVIQPIGTPTESDDGGFLTVSRCRMRLVGYPGELGTQSAVEWNGQRWSVDGDPIRYNGSPRTRHIDYISVGRPAYAAHVSQGRPEQRRTSVREPYPGFEAC
jgi:hypothetical protein